MVRFIGMVGQPRRNFTKMASWSRTSEHLVNPIGMSDQLKWNNQLKNSNLLIEDSYNIFSLYPETNLDFIDFIKFINKEHYKKG